MASSTDFPDLDALYSPPAEFIQKAVMRHLLPFHAAYIERATFFCLATGRADGLDASPRGGSPGFGRVIDARTVAFADWPGNNRIESMRNLKEDARAALLFIFPGLEIFLRINGHAGVSTDAGLLGLLAESGKIPKTAITVHIDPDLLAELDRETEVLGLDSRSELIRLACRRYVVREEKRRGRLEVVAAGRKESSNEYHPGIDARRTGSSAG